MYYIKSCTKKPVKTDGRRKGSSISPCPRQNCFRGRVARTGWRPLPPPPNPPLSLFSVSFTSCLRAQMPMMVGSGWGGGGGGGARSVTPKREHVFVCIFGDTVESQMCVSARRETTVQRRSCTVAHVHSKQINILIYGVSGIKKTTTKNKKLHEWCANQHPHGWN